MKRRLDTFLGTILISTLMLSSCSNSDSKKTITPTTTNINDTTFLQTIKWDSLNTYVDYHILQNGSKTTDTNLYFTIKPIAIYQHMQGKFQLRKDSTTINCKANDLKDFLLSDSFSDRTNFECLLRINSQIGFRWSPDVLQTVFVKAKDMSDDNIKWLMTDLRKENFTQDIKLKVAKPTALDTLMRWTTKTVFINIKLKPKYWDLKKINDVCNQLIKRPDVDTAFFGDFFTGLNESEMIYHLTTDEKSSR